MFSPIVRILVWLGVGLILLGFLALFFPIEIAFPNQIEYAMEFFFETLWDFDFLLPVSSIFTMFYISLFLEVSFFAVYLILWIVSVLTGHGK